MTDIENLEMKIDEQDRFIAAILNEMGSVYDEMETAKKSISTLKNQVIEFLKMVDTDEK